MSCKVVICGAGFLGRHIGKVLLNSGGLSGSPFQVQMSSRHPEKIWEALHSEIASLVPHNCLLPPVPVDITKPSTIKEAFKDASVVVSLVGIMHGTLRDFEKIQWVGAENVAVAARDVGAKLIHFSAIGADAKSSIPYTRTKGLGERSVLAIDPTATIIRPSIVFGPEDNFFNRFARLSKILPFLPVFAGGATRFQPVYVDDLACAVSIIARNDPKIKRIVEGKIIEAGGPQIFTYRELMQLILDMTGRKRPIISLPFGLGILQGAILEKLPVNLFTVTQAQVEQLKLDNIVSPHMPPSHLSLENFLSRSAKVPLHSVHEILPTYLC